MEGSTLVWRETGIPFQELKNNGRIKVIMGSGAAKEDSICLNLVNLGWTDITYSIESQDLLAVKQRGVLKPRETTSIRIKNRNPPVVQPTSKDTKPSAKDSGMRRDFEVRLKKVTGTFSLSIKLTNPNKFHIAVSSNFKNSVISSYRCSDSDSSWDSLEDELSSEDEDIKYDHKMSRKNKRSEADDESDQEPDEDLKYFGLSIMKIMLGNLLFFVLLKFFYAFTVLSMSLANCMLGYDKPEFSQKDQSEAVTAIAMALASTKQLYDHYTE